MSLDPQIEKILREEELAAGKKPAAGPVIEDVRRQLERRTARFRERHAPPSDCDVRAVDVAGLQSRLYFPHGATEPPPLLVFFHGGGFVAGSVDTHDGLARELCTGAKFAVLSIGYRLAPENRFPAAVNDGTAALQWAFGHADRLGCDASRIMIGGDSAGANIAAVTAIKARDEGAGRRLSGQILIYPVTDHYSGGHGSYTAYASRHGLTRDSMIWYWDQYAGNKAEADNPLLSPLRAPSLGHLPPACVVTAECDPLHDEGELYARRLRDAGVDTLFVDCAGMNHGFMRFAGIVDGVRPVIAQITYWMRQRADQERAAPTPAPKARYSETSDKSGPGQWGFL